MGSSSLPGGVASSLPGSRRGVDAHHREAGHGGGARRRGGVYAQAEVVSNHTTNSRVAHACLLQFFEGVAEVDACHFFFACFWRVLFLLVSKGS